MSSITSKSITSTLMFLGFLFVLILLVPRVSNAGQYLTGNWNSWIYWDGCIGGWAEETQMVPSSTLQSYQIDSSNRIYVNQWGWQDNGWSPYAEFPFYQVLQVPGSSGTNVGIQVQPKGGSGLNMWSYTGPTVSYYIGTSGTRALSYYSTDAGGYAVEVGWTIYNSGGSKILDSYEPLPTNWEGYSLQNPVMYYQNTFVGLAESGGVYSTVDYVSGAGQFTYYNLFDSGMYISQSNTCINSITGENSNMQYSSVSCANGICTQNFNAASGYEGHSTLGQTSFRVVFGGGWGFTTAGVQQGDLLIATEATYTGGCTYCFSISDSQGNTWTSDGDVGGPGYCSPNDCVSIYHAIAKSSGPDTVTFGDTNTQVYAYGFVREFLLYPGTVATSSYASGSSGNPSVPSFNAGNDLVIAVVAESAGGWSTGQYYYMIGSNWGWYAATEFAPAWQHGSTTAPWAGSGGAAWAELAVAYSPP